MTGLWQVLGRSAISFDEMLRLDYKYVTSWTLWNDFRLLGRTIPLVFSGRGEPPDLLSVGDVAEPLPEPEGAVRT
jgi:lipopolysaccharide/colanic/teichoic acid biosynthesis glycosyltransferase